MSFDVARIQRRLRAERRKVTVLLTLVTVGLLLWGRLLLMRDVPRTATADPEGSAQEGAAKAEQTDRPAERGTERRTVRVKLAERTDRDLFELRRHLYPPAESAEPQGEKPPEVAKSGSEQADERSQERRAIRSQARSLRLQSTILGATPRAMINGTLLEPGQRIRGFELIRVGSRKAILRKAGVEIVLEM